MMKNLGIIAFVVILIGVLAYVNKGISINNQTAQSTPPVAVPAKKTAAMPAASAATMNMIPPFQVAGNLMTARNSIAVGWEYDNANQSHTQALSNALDAVIEFTRTHKNTSAVIADVDIPADARQPPARSIPGVGIFLNGRPLKSLNDNPGEGSSVAPAISAALHTLIH